MDDPSLTSQEEDIYLVGSSNSRTQHTVLIAIGTTSACLSIFGSTCILLMSRKKLLQKHSYHRLLAGLSVADIIFSVTCVIQPWALPHKIMSPSVVTSSFGSETTCSMTGLIFLLATSTVALYNAFLSVHFVLIVVFNWTTEMIVRRFERYAHVVAWVLPWGFQLPLFVTDGFNPDEFYLICLPMGYPPMCEDDNSCIRGDKAAQFRGYFGVFTAIVVLVGFGGTLWVYTTFRRQVRNSSTYSDFSSMTTVRRKLLQRVKTRSILYSMVYLNNICWFAMAEIINEKTNLSTTDPNLVHIFQYVSYAFFPLQGFLNMQIYVYPLIAAHRQNVTPKPGLITTFFALLQKSIITSSSSLPQSASSGNDGV